MGPVSAATASREMVASCAGPAALAQRALLLEAVCDDAARGAESVLRRLAAPLRLPPVTAPAALRGYAVDLVRAPDGIWRTVRDRVGDHPAAAVLEAPVLATFLPELCRVLLGQSLLLPSMPVWWLGDPGTLALLRALPAHGPCRYDLRRSLDPHIAPLPLADPCPTTRRQLQDTVAASPHEYVVALNLQLPILRTRVPLP